jgi:hypothetical protein
MRPRIAEIGQHPVAHEFGDKPVIARDDPGNGGLIGTDLLAQFLGVEPHRQGGRADQITEHHRQLPPLGLAGDCRSGSWCEWRFGSAEQGDGVEQASAVADRRDAQLAQILGRQPA